MSLMVTGKDRYQEGFLDGKENVLGRILLPRACESTFLIGYAAIGSAKRLYCLRTKGCVLLPTAEKTITASTDAP